MKLYCLKIKKSSKIWIKIFRSNIKKKGGFPPLINYKPLFVVVGSIGK